LIGENPRAIKRGPALASGVTPAPASTTLTAAIGVPPSMTETLDSRGGVEHATVITAKPQMTNPKFTGQPDRSNAESAGGIPTVRRGKRQRRCLSPPCLGRDRKLNRSPSERRK
jgi:hypothetical protein